MHKKIRTAAVIGSGVMGSAIAAHLAGVGISCWLLDIVPNSLTAEEGAAGLSLQHPKVRNKLATGAIAKLKKTNPAPLYSEVFADRITPGNLEDHLGELAKVDWIIEVVVERLDVKKSLLATIESVWTPGTIVSSNTSGISINEMVSDRSDAFKAHFLGTHFFNPPRYMKLLEIIPGEQTNAEVVQYMSEFCEKILGKGVVIAKDTPNFIANRIGTYGLMATLSEMLEKGYTVEEIEAVTGPAMGRPKSATFRTLDLVGLDTFVHVAQNVYDHVNTEEEKKIFHIPDVLREMVARGWTGEKNGQGFYKKVKDESGKQILALNLATLEYAPTKKVSSASLEASKAAKGTAAKVKALISANDRYAELAWNLLKPVLLYSAQLLGEIADSIVEIDNAMKWGFNWNLGPFELWDAIGLVKSVQRMESEGNLVPGWVKEWIANGHTSFYKSEPGSTFYYSEGKYKGIESKPEIISLKSLKEQNKVIISNSGASLIDIGDDIACLEFHSNNNAIGEDILSMISRSVDEVRNNYRGLVLANEGRHFCVGANLMLLLMEIQDDEWDEVNHIIKTFQDTMMKLKWFEKPVVAAPHSMTLGGGVEACLPADQIAFSAETYFGLVEVGVGLIPAGGGCKEVALMASKHLPNPEHDLQPLMNQYFETIGMAKVSTSGHDTKRLGFMRSGDFVVVNQDYRVYEAKQAVLRMDAAGYKVQLPEKIRVVGDTGKAILQTAAYTMRQGGYISKHDQLIAGKLAHVLAGGNVPAGTYVTEQYMLDLEREAFMSLCGEPKTQQRMQSLLTTGKAVRN
ncbi:3-hydroxyacyl-CoA dehydrogenase/enoyl-CoA hydratase family protein [Paenibacillus albiflavus]|uniref:3-hydroxyacyl-CoA dehydrogenase/enoyl-CoA hydratase family protein n=1 Tax=Paenibacillus albiflavus TaxID=2545760 RepID=A0A4R4E332_9BACL|nr:3-hydroxyacyl-CoA dehydrogenase/enoyl-CoA hydratase family protein [Paenibacillus albiflavus]TCZ73203.1 3-hydroxyacyl-CoA dehydrogenase/enoyl-CoA hydratase family protein [Paenibacillus albiflavus]